MSPFSPAYSQVPNQSLNSNYVAGLAGCTNVNLASGAATCNATISGSGSGGFLGTISNTVFVFGNFFAALGFLAQLAIGVAVPGMYVFSWTYAVFGNYEAALGIASLFQVLVMIAYAYDFFYIVSGRLIQPNVYG